jgi:hypothetical protein
VRMVHLGRTKLVRMADLLEMAVPKKTRRWLNPNWETTRRQLTATRGSNSLASRVHRRVFRTLHSATRNGSPDGPLLHTTDWRVSTVGSS